MANPQAPSSSAAATEPTGLAARFARIRARLEMRRRERAATGDKSPKLFLALVASVLVLLTAFASSLTYLSSDPEGREVSLDQLAALITADRVESARFLDEDSQVVVQLRSAEQAAERKAAEEAPAEGDETAPPAEGSEETPAAEGAEPAAPDTTFAEVEGVPDEGMVVRTALPSSGSVTPKLTEAFSAAGVKYEIDPQSFQSAIRVVTEFLLPVLILVNLFGLLFVGKGGGSSAIGEVTNFGRVDDGSRTGESSVTFADVGGAEEAVTELAEVRDYLKDPARYKALGATPPKGVLLFGPPGTGKTLLARAVAGEAGVPFFSVAGAEFVESLVGVGAARIRDLFRRVNAVAPAIVFIDELDAAGRKRGSGGGGGGSDEREQTLNQLLVEMDGFDVSTGVVVIAATNRPDILDPALMRPGRFDRHITVERPDAEGRERILRIHAAKKPLAPDVDLERIAARCPGFTGADLASTVNEAALLTIRRGGTQIEMKELELAIVRVLEGPQRRGRVLTEEERLRAAYHEIGHVVVAAALGRHEDVHRVTVLSRGRTVAAASFADTEATLLTKSALHAQLVATLGGIAAEELVLGEGSTGGEQDLEHATDLARDMVTRYGMSDEVGPVRLQVKAGEGFLGDDSALVGLSPETQRDVEDAVRRLITSAQDEATAVLRAHRGELDSLAQRLDEEETLEDEVLQEALAPLLTALDRASAAPPVHRRRRPTVATQKSVSKAPRGRAPARS